MRIAYFCNPELDTECSKTFCGQCRHTTKIECSKNYKELPSKEIIEKHFIEVSDDSFTEADGELIVDLFKGCCDCNASELLVERIAKFIRLNL